MCPMSGMHVRKLFSRIYHHAVHFLDMLIGFRRAAQGITFDTREQALPCSFDDSLRGHGLKIAQTRLPSLHLFS